MGHPQRLQTAAEAYLNLVAHPQEPPTFEGLALACGFSSFNQMKTAIITPDQHPEESQHILIQACAHIAHIYQQNSLVDNLNSSFVKYLLSAYLNISEKHSTTHTEDRTITIKWEQPPNAPAPPVPEIEHLL